MVTMNAYKGRKMVTGHVQIKCAQSKFTLVSSMKQSMGHFRDSPQETGTPEGSQSRPPEINELMQQ